MPGRHGSGPLGGGGMGGGGGFRGGGFGGGWGMRGPGFGGFYRRPWFGGWGMGWLPWLPFIGGWFGPRMGYGGFGPGCGGFGCIMIAVVIGFFACFGSMCASTGGVFGRYRTYGSNGYNAAPSFNGNAANDSNSDPLNSNGQAKLSNETAPIQTQTARDLTELHTAFDSRIPDWQAQLSPNDSKSIAPADAGLTQDNNTKEVLYGKCGTALYVYVVENSTPENVPANNEGYVYTTASSPGACHPAKYFVYDSEDVGGNWYFVYLKNNNG